MKMYVVMNSLESPHLGNSNEYTQHIITLQKIEKTSLNYPHLPPENYSEIFFLFFFMKIYVVCTHKYWLIEAILMSTFNKTLF